MTISDFKAFRYASSSISDRNQLVLIAGNIINAFSELLKNGKGDYYGNQEQMARAIELEKFLSSKKEIAAADDVRLFRIKEDIYCNI